MIWSHRWFRSAATFYLGFFLIALAAACTGEQEADPDVALEAVTPAPGEAGEATDQVPGDTVDAHMVLAAALAEAAETDRLVFLHSGADW